jgi:hypothetical protein
MTQMNKNTKNFLILGAVLLVAVIGVASAYNTIAREKNRSGLVAFVDVCAAQNRPVMCLNLAAVEANFGISLISEIEKIHAKTRDTAHKIAAGNLTDAAYRACIKTNECAPVPMLPASIDPASPEAQTGENAIISKTFWAFAEKDQLDSLQCDYITACALAVSSGLLSLNKGTLAAAPQEKPL